MRADARLLAGAALCLMAASAGAQTTDFDGDWTLNDPARCVFGTDSPDFARRIAGGVFSGLESECRLTNPTAIRGMSAVLFDAECSGEGQSWSYRILLMQDGRDHLIELQDGMALRYTRCQAK